MQNLDPDYPNIVILTGAGISAESGLETFRSEDGMWNNFRVEEVATPQAFEDDPEMVQSFYNMRRRELHNVEPNAAHRAIAELEKNWPGEVLIVTQNVDDLHERAGSHNLIHMHGELKKSRCINTEHVMEQDADITDQSKCECCNDFDTLRPHIVWFEELPLDMERIYDALANCGIFVAVGTSGNVFPAADFVNEASNNGFAHTVELNLQESEVTENFDDSYQGPATDIVPGFVHALLGGTLMKKD
jgi:NAD-dependent deacetylase